MGTTRERGLTRPDNALPTTWTEADMLDVLKKYREPLAWLTLTLVVASGVRQVVALVAALVRGYTFPQAASVYGYVLHTLGYLVLVALVLACVAVKPPTPHAGRLSLVALWVGLVATSLDLVFGIASLFHRPGDGLMIFYGAVGALITVGFKAALTAVAWAIHRAATRLAPGSGLEAAPPSPVVEAAGSSTSSPATSSGAVAPQRPTWQPTEASGGAWHRAGDAATGAGATTWGTPGQQSQGWQVARPPRASDASQPSPDDPGPRSRHQVIWGQGEQRGGGVDDDRPTGPQEPS